MLMSSERIVMKSVSFLRIDIWSMWCALPLLWSYKFGNVSYWQRSLRAENETSSYFNCVTQNQKFSRFNLLESCQRKLATAGKWALVKYYYLHRHCKVKYNNTSVWTETEQQLFVLPITGRTEELKNSKHPKKPNKLSNKKSNKVPRPNSR